MWELGVLFMTPVLPTVATTYEKTQNTDTGIKVASYSANARRGSCDWV